MLPRVGQEGVRLSLRFLTAGESHGQALTAVLEGMPAGLRLPVERINVDLARRQQGYGRGRRMQIEKDEVEILSGVRLGYTLGSPITLQLKNRDWKNWEERMTPYLSKDAPVVGEPPGPWPKERVRSPRPGHADLAGALKYAHKDLRNVLERASARETAARVAVGAVTKVLLERFGIQVGGFVVALGKVRYEPGDEPLAALVEKAEASEVRCPDPEASQQMIEQIEIAKQRGDTLGGIFEIRVTGVPPGLGSHVQWDRKLDARLAFALMSIQAMKGVEFGLGFEAATRFGSEVHDPIGYRPYPEGEIKGPEVLNYGFYHHSNNAGGIEGGMTNGEPIVVRVAMKPISTLYTPLESVAFDTKEILPASVERSDHCALPAAVVVGEAVVAFEIARAFLEKFGGDSIQEIERNYYGYLDYLRRV